MDPKIYITALRMCPGVGNKTLSNILNFFNTPEEAWNLFVKYPKELALTDKQIDAIGVFRKSLSLQKLEEIVKKSNITVVTIFDKEYPEALKEIYNPPTVLFFRGKALNDNFNIAIVGSRRPTPYGKVVAEKLAEDLARDSVTVISGAARGIDTCAHKGALRNGDTVAVLGCGVDVVYPRENASLLQEIAEVGTVVSEFPPGTAPDARHFPARNRIISGLSQGVIVVEAAEKSGSLITADFALEQGREVFAVPGPITSTNSVGCHHLIKTGAKLITSVSDVYEEFDYVVSQITKKPEIPNSQLSIEETQVLNALNYKPVHIEEILNQTKLSIGTVSKILAFLEINRDIRQLPGQYYVLDKVITR